MSRFSINFTINSDSVKMDISLPRTMGLFKQVKREDIVVEGKKISHILNALCSGKMNEYVEEAVLASPSRGLAEFICQNLEEKEEQGPAIDPRRVFGEG